ncbi:MAG: 30S ribosomal protein S19 [Methanothrix sp.]|uniref:Small ribosomal subunit protein uS19 n=1 Tax=Methanothrix harundinacea TaxID=301375 RepID=A0A101FV98_9EURY|nr:MAG: 30S ribosomal protein S19P [Methanothrix harundinacea]MDD3710365.1 30S ribosomal protein S19 [Methanothrix sp.]MDI9399980.1 30S ribosomal protein S19 [Euryarchaeota archaeon]KUK95162.1 MAG: 30S ribosomal protein S19P [Methanothrix harundinacea]MCP1391320.1 30S ribosomal protein S19 [Methanothrix harundinacea]
MARKSGSRLPKRKEEFTYRGLKVEELKKLSTDELMALLPARQRRRLKRGLTKDHRRLLSRVKDRDVVRTHLRDMIVLPEMVGKTIEIYNGKMFNRVEIMPEMVGHYFGEYSLTRGRVSHGSAGVGATRSSKFVPLK